MIGGGIVIAIDRGRRRRHADHGNSTRRPVDPFHRVQMMMAVQYQIGAVLPEYAADGGGIDQTLLPVLLAGRWMMNEHHAIGGLLLQPIEDVREPPDLLGPDLSGRKERKRRQRRRYADERNRPATA